MIETPRQIAVAGIQMVSSDNKQKNLIQAGHLIRQAAEAGATVVALPEYFCFMGHKDEDKQEHAEWFGEGPIQQFLAEQAQKHQVLLIGGTLPLRSELDQRFFNSCLVYAPTGHCVLRYDKIHLFGFSRGTEHYDESRAIRAGNISTPCLDKEGIGIGICYDLRFPEFFRQMAGVNLLVIPSAFTYTTGQAHWEILLRARAIENQCYVLAPAQGGHHDNGRQTWGHTMLIDPWGMMIACLPTGVGMVNGIIDLDHIAAIRESLPALRHRRSGFIKEKDSK